MAKILIIDDSIVARMSVKGCIPKDCGHELAEAADGTTALALFRTMRPDITFPESIIIILSADTQKQTQEKAEQLGAFSMIKKPPVKQVIQSEIARALTIMEGCHER